MTDNPSTSGRAARRRHALAAAQQILLHARTMSDDELLAAFTRMRVGHLLAGPLAFATGTILLVVHGVLQLLSNWRLVLLELIPAVWLGAVLWDWRFHVLQGHDLPLITGWSAVGVALFVAAVTVVSFWCNVAFGYAAVGRAPHLRVAVGVASRHWRLIVGAGLVVGLVHAWVAVRAMAHGAATYALALGAVALLDMYLYSALPAQAMGINRNRDPRGFVTRTVAVGALSVLVSVPGLALALVAHLMLGVPFLRIVGIVVLVVAVVVQIAAVSSSRAVRLSTNVFTGG